MPFTEIRSWVNELSKCRYKSIYDVLEVRCACIIFIFALSIYYSAYKVLVKEMGLSFSIVVLSITALIAVSALWKLITEKKKKKYIIESDGFKWRVTRYINNSLSVDETPLCGKDEVPLVRDGQVLYCPKCNEVKMKSGDLLNFLRRVNSKAEADRDSSIKVPKRYIPA